ncbi:MAG: F0F1 ATP synthase subunit A [Clostridiales bacterium]|nr:F0F1 ATP synthase subunit A [Clostridiales bacterium]
MTTALIMAGSWLSEFFAAFAEKFAERFSSDKDIGSEISEAILQVKMYFNVGDYKILITDAIIVTWVAVIAMLIVLTFLIGKPSKDLKLTKGQAIVVSLTELVISTAMSFGMNRKQAEEVTPMILTFGLVITACNSISYFHLPPPAKNIAFPIGCAITAIIYVIVMTFKFVGPKGFWITLTTPIVVMIPFKLLDYVVKPLSLALRLFGNVFAAFIFMEFLSISVPIILPGVAGLWFDIVDGLIQAIVFSYLTMSYIGENVESVNEYNEGAEEREMEKRMKKENKKAKKSKTVAA